MANFIVSPRRFYFYDGNWQTGKTARVERGNCIVPMTVYASSSAV